MPSQMLWRPLLLLLACCQQILGLKTLLIGGLFGIDTSRGGWNSAGIIPAVQMAFDDINNRSDILDGYRLELEIKDSKCNIGESVKALVEYISVGKPKVMLLGPGCSQAAFPIAESAHYWNILQIGFASASPLFSQKSTYPLYFRTNPSEHHSSLGRVALIKTFNWKKVAILQMNQDVFTGITNSLASLLKASNISIVAYESFTQDPRIAVENLKRKDARIIFGFFYIKELYMVFCEAFKQGYFGSKYVWILNTGRYGGKWWNDGNIPAGVDCTPGQLRKGMSNVLGTGEIKLSTSKMPTVSKVAPSEWYAQYLTRTKQDQRGVNIFASYGYDAAWTCALTLNASIGALNKTGLKLEDFNYTHADMRKVFVDVMGSTSFMGMTGHVRFDKNFDRITQLEISQLQGDEEKRVALYDMESDKYIDDTDTGYQWLGGNVPVDGLLVTKKEKTVPDWLFWLVTGLAVVGIIVGLAVLSFNIHKRKVRYIKMSSPNLNNVLVIGCILIYASGVLNGYHGSHLTKICKVELWTLTIGCTLAFGAMFSKTWRVHQIFLSKKSNKRVIIRDFQLFGIIGFLLLIDFIILICWVVIDPLVETKHELALEISGDVAVLPYIKQCSCKHMVIWKSLLLVFKGLLLLFGAYLAWETRHVHITALNDSRLIGMCVYNAVVVFSVVVPAQSVLASEPTISFALLNGLILFSTTFTICVMFIPKIIFLRNNDGNDIRACTGSSSKVSTGTSKQNNEESINNDTVSENRGSTPI